MPEYLAPGVYIEEVSFRAKTIEGVSTSTAGFLGPTRYGPTSGEPELLTSFSDFERLYGGLERLMFEDGNTPPGQIIMHNYLAHAVRAFFNEGGRRLYVSRTYTAVNGDTGLATYDRPGTSPPEALLSARFPGRAGDMRITFIPRISGNLFSGGVVQRIQEHDTVLLAGSGSPPPVQVLDVVRVGDELQLHDATGSQVNPTAGTDEVYLLTVDVGVERPRERPKRPRERYEPQELLLDYTLHPEHGSALTRTFAATPNSRTDQLYVPFAINVPAGFNTGVEMADLLLGNSVIEALANEDAPLTDRRSEYTLSGGSDGLQPSAETYLGDDGAVDGTKDGLRAFEVLEDISIVAAPGYSWNYSGANESRVETIEGHLINHCEGIMHYRVAVLDAPNDQTLGQIRNYRGRIDSTHAALYYPWITILDPVTEEEIIVPPSGHVAGIYARNDVEYGVHKAPANEVVRQAIGFERLLNKGQQDVLNPEGINCFRFFEGRGYRLWGARTVSSDPEWKYVNVRRYFAYLERSIERGTQWAVFENNNEPLWNNVRRTIEDFLFNEWKSGRLMGTTPKEAYFVRCDRSTMTQNDIDNGRLICLIGVAPIKPAEFVIFRIGQWTADASV